MKTIFTTVFKRLMERAVTKPRKLKVGFGYNSQPYVLVSRMMGAGIKHDQKVLADLDEVRIMNMGKESLIKFCPLDNIKVTEKYSEGDCEALTSEVNTDQLIAPARVIRKPGTYRVENIILYANGEINISSTEKTKWTRIRS